MVLELQTMTLIFFSVELFSVLIQSHGFENSNKKMDKVEIKNSIKLGFENFKLDWIFFVGFSCS
jgi:hypothetical protein